MRILHLVSYPLYSGPLAPTVQLAMAQRRLGHTAWLAFDHLRRWPNDYEPRADQMLEALGLDHELAPPVELFLSSARPASAWRSLAGLRRLLGPPHAVDVVHAHTSHDHVLAVMAGVPRARLVRTLHQAHGARRRGFAMLARRTGGLIVRAAGDREALAGARGSPVVVQVPGSVDAKVLHPPTVGERLEARRRLGLPESEPVIVHAALLAGRGQEELIGGLAGLGDASVHLLIAGRGEREASLRRQVDDLGLAARVHFAGWLDEPGLVAAYHAADLAFVGRLGKDGSARAVLEAWASGLPVLAPAQGVLAELVDESVGYPAPDLATASLIRALERWRAEPLDPTRGLAARQRALGDHDPSAEAERTVALYRSLGER